MSRSSCPRRHGPGFTLFEVLIASTILALAVIALTQAVLAGQMQTHAAMRSGRAVSLANAMIEEILAHAYPGPDADAPGDTNFGPEPGEVRTDSDSTDTYQTMDDYDGFDEPSEAPKIDLAGEGYPDTYDRFRRTVNLTDATMKIPGTDAQVPGLTITVTIQDGLDGRQWTLERFVPDPDPDDD